MTEQMVAVVGNRDEANIMTLMKNLNRPEVYKEINATGRHIVDKNREEWALTKTKVREIITGSKGAEQLGKKMVELRVATNRIDKLTQVSKLKKMFSSESKIITKAIMKYEDIEVVVDTISKDMRVAVSMLEGDSKELAEAASWIKEQKQDIERTINLLKQMIAHLEVSEEVPLEQQEKDRLYELLATRCQDLTIISSAYDQFDATIKQTIFNNSREAQTAERLETVVSIIAGTGLIIRAAMNRQQSVSELNEQAKQFTAEMLTQNANALADQTEASKQSYGDMSSVMDALKEAYGTISQALEEESTRSRELADKAMKNVAELDNLQETLEKELSAKEKINEQIQITMESTERSPKGELEKE